MWCVYNINAFAYKRRARKILDTLPFINRYLPEHAIDFSAELSFSMLYVEGGKTIHHTQSNTHTHK